MLLVVANQWLVLEGFFWEVSQLQRPLFAEGVRLTLRLKGGLSLFYNSYGLGMDQVVRFQVISIRDLSKSIKLIQSQVVLTSGDIVNATPTQNADLYKALKGGLTNMGTPRRKPTLEIEPADQYAAL